MKLNIFQDKAVRYVDTIDRKYGNVHDVDTTMIHLTEEMGEIARQVYNGKMGRKDTDVENLKEEIADVLILLSKLAQLYNIELEDAAAKKFDMLKERWDLDI